MPSLFGQGEGADLDVASPIEEQPCLHRAVEHADNPQSRSPSRRFRLYRRPLLVEVKRSTSR
jgi:hypothetical protein